MSWSVLYDWPQLWRTYSAGELYGLAENVMHWSDKAREAAEEVVAACKTPPTLIDHLARLVARKKRPGVISDEWSYRNQLIVALRGYSEARGYRNWLQVGRRVRKSQRAFYIVAPWLKKKEEKTAKADEKEEEKVLVGFRAVPVFGLEQTEPDRDWKLEKKYNPLFGETDETVWIVDGYRQPWYQWYSAIRPDAEDQLTAHLGAAVVAKVFSEATELQDLLNQLSSHSAEEIAERIDEACKAAAAYLEAHARAEA